ncbi:MAG: methyltransferase [Phycisphaerae bacterium]
MGWVPKPAAQGSPSFPGALPPFRARVYTLVMRIIAGTWRGRNLEAPPGEKTRPILDRAKTVLFDMLGARLAEPGRLPPLAVLDLFAGSGALGLEALSRGARFCLFVEQDRSAAAVLRRNLDALKIVREARVIEADAATADWPAPEPRAAGQSRYDLVFLDPPYRRLAGARPDERIQTLLRRLAGSPLVASDALIVVRHELQDSGGPDLAPLFDVERRDVGTMTFRFLATTPLPAPVVGSPRDRS